MLADGDGMFGSRGSSQEGQGQHFCWGVGGKCWMKTRTWEKIIRIWLGEDKFLVRNQGRFCLPGKYKDKRRQGNYFCAFGALVGLPCPYFLQHRES